MQQLPDISNLQKARSSYKAKLPAVFVDNGPLVAAVGEQPTAAEADCEAIKAHFPNTYGAPIISFTGGGKGHVTPLKAAMIFSGGQAPGGHNVAAGLFDALRARHPDSLLYGFLGGPSGLLDDRYRILDAATIDAYRNTGGFDMIGSGRTKLETEAHFAQVAATCHRHDIDAVVVIGGDDSNTNACMLAEYFLQNKQNIQVIGCPKTIDGDLKNRQIETSFGFDTAVKVYSELIGNIQRDADSARKYWHFIKLMGRSASHIALECALQTHPNVALISEEIADRKATLKEIVETIADAVKARAEQSLDYGVILIPEGLIEFIPEMKTLIAELNDLLAEHEDEFAGLPSPSQRFEFLAAGLNRNSGQLFQSLPDDIKLQLTMDRDPHGNVQVSRIETEKLLMNMVEKRLQEARKNGEYTGAFSGLTHFFGYEGRCAAPSNYDADYCYSLGYTAACLIAAGKTGYLASVQNTNQKADQWRPGGIPLTMMMNIERRKGKDTPVIRKALVDLNGAPFKTFAAARSRWQKENCFIYPGPIQYFGPPEVTDQPTVTLQLELQ